MPIIFSGFGTTGFSDMSKHTTTLTLTLLLLSPIAVTYPLFMFPVLLFAWQLTQHLPGSALDCLRHLGGPTGNLDSILLTVASIFTIMIDGY